MDVPLTLKTINAWPCALGLWAQVSQNFHQHVAHWCEESNFAAKTLSLYKFQVKLCSDLSSSSEKVLLQVKTDGIFCYIDIQQYSGQ